MLDLVIKNGKIVDGTGNPWFYGDVAIKDGMIVQVGNVEQEARSVVDANRQVVSPGFIDGHCHSDLMILKHPDSEIKLQQGVTTEVVGNCGIAPAPICGHSSKLLQDYVQPILGDFEPRFNWSTVSEYMNFVQNSAPSGNIATYVAHGALRIAVMGFENRPATAQELQQMKDMLEEGMKAGAIGLSLGLMYVPGSYSTKEEIAELCSVLPKYDGLLSAHVRGEGKSLLPSLKEVIWIAEKSGVAFQASHLKSAGKRYWGQVEQAMEMIEDSRAKGHDITVDVYPYTAGSTSLTTVLPPWVLEGGIDATLERLKEPSIRKRVVQELGEEQDTWDNLVCSTGWQAVIISSLVSSKNKHLEGKSVLEVSEMRGIDPREYALDLLLEENGKVSIVYFHMSESDVDKVIKWDKSMFVSDSLTCESGKPHPRLFGTFPRVFSTYVREKRLITLEDAVRKMTSFPAKRFKLGKRGLLLPDYRADIVIFHPDTIHDTATYQDPMQYPDGIMDVFVNGVKTTESKTKTGAREGEMIRRDHHGLRRNGEMTYK